MPIARAAREAHVLLMLDMEHYESKNIVLGSFRRLLEQPEFHDWPHAGIALQTYLKETDRDLEALLEWTRRHTTPITVRLVRGAYWDAERAIARQQGWNVPVWGSNAAPEPVSDVFRNLPLRRFTGAGERQTFADQLDVVAQQLGAHYPLPVLATRTGRPILRSLNPARPEQLVGTLEAADPADVAPALAAAAGALPAWAGRSMRSRADLLDQVADTLTVRRDEFVAWELFEAGKGWVEADADVAEAVDFLRFYAREARAAPASAAWVTRPAVRPTCCSSCTSAR